MIIRTLLAVLLLAGPAWAVDPMTGAEFRAFSEGYTLHVEDETGEHFGSDQFPGGDRSIWLQNGGECSDGVWAEVEDKICFLYEAAGVSCWLIFRDGPTSLRFQSVPTDEELENEPLESPTTLILRLTKRTKRPLICPNGPSV